MEDARHDAVSKWYNVLYVYENFYTSAIATTKISDSLLQPNLSDEVISHDSVRHEHRRDHVVGRYTVCCDLWVYPCRPYMESAW